MDGSQWSHDANEITVEEMKDFLKKRGLSDMVLVRMEMEKVNIIIRGVT